MIPRAYAADGSGTAAISPTAVLASSSGNTVTVTYTAAETMDSGEVGVTVPTGWTAPQGTGGSAGYTTVASTGTLGKVEDTADSATGWATGTACATSAPSADTTTKHEGSASVSCGNGNEAAGDVWYKNISSENWSTFNNVGFWIYSSGSVTSGHLQFSYDDSANLASPLESISVGALSATTWTYVNLSFGATTRTGVVAYGFRINNASGMDNKTVKVDDILLGPFTTPTFASQDVKVRLLSLANTQTVTFTYGSGGGSSGATAPATLGAHTFTVKNRISDSSGSLTNISSSPTVDVVPSATKALVGLTGQTVNGNSISGSCPTIGGGVAITVAGTPTATTAGTAIDACVYATDNSNNFASLATNNTSISSTPNDSQGTYPSAANLVNGKGTFLVTFKTATSYTVTATPASLTAGTSSSITINPDATSKLVITTNPSSVTAGNETSAFVVTRRDQYDNATTTGTQTVNLSSNSSGANKQFRDSAGGGGVTSVTIGGGSSTEDFFYYDDKAGSWSISVAFSGLTGDSRTLTVNPAATSTLVITSNPSSVTAGNETTAYVVERRDQYANTVTSGTQTVNLTSTSGGANKQFRDSAGGGAVSSVTIGNGNSTEDFFYYDDLAGSYTIAVAFSGLTGDSKSLTVNPASVNKLVITSNPSSHTAGVETTSYVVERRDQYNNPITAGTQTVNLSSTSTGANKQFRDSAGGAGVSSVTIGAGNSTEDFYYYDEKAGSWSISVAFTGLTGDAKSLTTNPASTGKLVITSNPSSVTAGNETTAYVVERRDQFDNTTSTGTQTVNLSSTSTGANKQFRDSAGGAGVSSVTIGAGNTTEDFYYYDDKAGSWSISVAFTGLTGDSKALTVNATTTTTLTITSFPGSVTAGNETTAYVVERRDQYANPVTTGTQTVNLSSTSTGANKQFRDSAGGAGVSSVTIGAGNSTEDFFYYDDKAGSWSISVAFSGLTGDAKTLTVDPAATTQLVITSNPSSVIAGNETTAYVVERRDQYNNPTATGSQTVNLTSTSTGANKQFRNSSGGAGISSVTIANSSSTEDFFYYDDKAGSWSISVAFTGLTGDSKTLTVNPASTSNLVIISGPSSVTAGNETSAYVVRRQDAFGNTTSTGSQTVNLSSTSTGANKQFRDSAGGGGVSSVTIGAGNTTEDFYYYDEKAGSWSISVAFTGLTGDSTSLTVNAAATSQLVITTNPTTLTAGSESTPYTVERRDSFNNVVTLGSQSVGLSSNSTGHYQFRVVSGGSATSSLTITNGSGTANFYYLDDLAGVWQVTVSGVGLTGDSKSITVAASAGTTPTTSVPSSPAEASAPSASTEDLSPATPNAPPVVSNEPEPTPITEAEKDSWWVKIGRVVSVVRTGIAAGVNEVLRIGRTVSANTVDAISLLGGTVSVNAQAINRNSVQIISLAGAGVSKSVIKLDRLAADVRKISAPDLSGLSRFTAGVGGKISSASYQAANLVALSGELSSQTVKTITSRTMAGTSRVGQGVSRQTAATQAMIARIDLGVEKFVEIVFDREPNRISNVQAEVISGTEVILTWETNHLSTSQVNFGSAVGIYEYSSFDKTQTREHRVVLTNLEPSKTYFYELISKNGDYAVDAFRVFTTK